MEKALEFWVSAGEKRKNVIQEDTFNPMVFTFF